MPTWTKYAVLALLNFFYVFLVLPLLIPGGERWAVAIGGALLFLSILAVSALISAGIRRAVLGKSERWCFYPSLLVIVLYIGWVVSLLVLPFDE